MFQKIILVVLNKQEEGQTEHKDENNMVLLPIINERKGAKRFEK